jgi:hypothetical protein
MVQGDEGLFDIAIDPGFPTMLDALGTASDYGCKIDIGGDLKPILPYRLCERFGKVKAIQRQNRPVFRFDPKCLFIVTRIGHREDAMGIGFQQQVDIDRQIFLPKALVLTLIAPFASLG